MRSSRLSLSVVAALTVAAIFLLAPHPARASSPPWPRTALSGKQLAASSAAARKYGVPVNIVRGVSTYKYGSGVTTPDFNAEAQRLHWWYGKLYPKFGGAAPVNWARSTAAEMGPKANPQDIVAASGDQSLAITSILTAPLWGTVSALAAGAEAVGAAAAGEVSVAGAAADGAAAAAGGDAAEAAGGSAVSKVAGKVAGKLSSKLGNALSGGGVPADTPAMVMRTSGLAGLAGTATHAIAHYIGKGTAVNTSSGFFPKAYHTIETYAWLLAVIAVAAGALWMMVNSWTGSLSGFGILLSRIPVAGIGMVAVPVIAMFAMQIVDAACSSLLSAFPHTVTLLRGLGDAIGVLGATSMLAHIAHFSAISHVTGLGAWLLALASLVGAGAIALELLAREVAIYMTILIVPLALVGEIFGPFARWSTGLFKVLFVIIITKFFLVIGLVLAAGLIISGLTTSVVTVLAGVAALILISLFPAVVYASVIRVGEATWHSHAGTSVTAAPAHSMVQHVRMAGRRASGQVPESQTAILRDIREQLRPASNGNGGPPPPPTRKVSVDA